MKQASVHILVVGAGGLAAPALLALISAWPRTSELRLSIFDPDKIELSNLNRQILFTPEDLDKSKASVLAEKISVLGQTFGLSLNISSHEEKISESNLPTILPAVDAILDTCDSSETKFMLNDFAVLRNIPLVYAGVQGWNGLVYGRPRTDGASHMPCLRCLFGDASAAELRAQTESCQAQGIVGPAAGIVGFLQAEKMLQILFGAVPKTPHLTTFDARTGVHRIIEVCADSACPHWKLPPEPENKRRFLELRDQVCPNTFLLTKLALETLPEGSELEVSFGREEFRSSVMRSVIEEGHTVLALEQNSATDSWPILIRKRDEH